MEIRGCQFPDDVYFDVDNDIWLKPISPSLVLLGVTSILSFVAGKIKKVNLREGVLFTKPGQSIATVESGKYFTAIRSPIDARVVEMNQNVVDHPSLLNDSPYLDGWIAKMEHVDRDLSSLSETYTSLMKANQATLKLEERINELKVHCFSRVPDDELHAVGLECSTTLVNLNELLKTRPVGTIVHIVSDDPLSDIEMIRWADQTKNELIETKIEGKIYHFIVEKKHN
jgi:glycine cleavage system H protein